MTLGEYAEAVAKLCSDHDCSVVSWIRTPKRNKAVGGVGHSQHQLNEGGHAMDLVPDINTDEVRAAICRDAEIAGLQPIDERNHVHVQLKREAA